MDEVESISSILGDSPFNKGETAPAEPAPPAAESKAETPKTEPTPETEAAAETKARERDESGRFAPKAEKPAETQTEKSEPMVPLSALLAERARRRDPEAANKPKTSVFDDEDKGISERVSEYVEPLQKQVFDLQLRLVKADKPDFDDVVMTFLKAAQNDPVLKYQADNAPDQLDFIYREGKRLGELADVGGDIGKYRDKVTAQERAKYTELETRYKALEAQVATLTNAQKELAVVPRSLNSEQSGTPKAADVDPDDLKKIVRFK
jgi:hypothetical protein